MAKKDKEKKDKKKKSKDGGKAPAPTKKERLMMSDITCAWVFLQKPRPLDDDADDDAEPNYEVTGILDKKKDKKKIEKLTTFVKTVAKSANGGGGFDGDWLTPIKDGDKYNKKSKSPKDFYKGKVFFRAKTRYRPGVVTRSGEPAMPDDFDEMGYSGCRFHVSMNAGTYDHKGNQGVSLYLGNVMLRKEGKRLDGQISAEAEFADYADD